MHPFDHLFGHLAIGQDPTPLHNQYIVMRWDFSRVQSHGTVEQIETNLHQCINGDIRAFQIENRQLLQEPIQIHETNALETFSSALSAVSASGYKLYLFIDEYDNFANEVMMSVQQDMLGRYESLVTGEGLFKTFFKNLKSFGSGRGLDRVFVTGVSPFVMNDVTSGANVFEDIYWFQELNDLCGFYEHEVAEMLTSVLEERGFPETERAAKHAEVLDLMRTYYDGSWFTTETPPPPKIDATLSPYTSSNSASQTRLYNPTMVFYFLRYLQRTGKYPDEMLDRNLQADRGKLLYISHYATGRTLMVDALNKEAQIAVSKIGTGFGAREM
ncbi:MAG: AAA family ATPase [Chloroflexota bacterium]